jgi:hypothetical protein
MKKAKLMLSVIALVGALGTTFALNAHKYEGNFVYTGVTGTSSTACTTFLIDAAIVGGGVASVYASAISTPRGCPLGYIITVLGD